MRWNSNARICLVETAATVVRMHGCSDAVGGMAETAAAHQQLMNRPRVKHLENFGWSPSPASLGPGPPSEGWHGADWLDGGLRMAGHWLSSHSKHGGICRKDPCIDFDCTSGIGSESCRLWSLLCPTEILVQWRQILIPFSPWILTWISPCLWTGLLMRRSV